MYEPRLSLRRHEESILNFEAQPIVKGKILFYGSSSFTRWRTRYDNPELEDVIRMKDGSQAVVNHGFGGSTAEELLYFYPRAVVPWEPRALVLYAYGNDYRFGYGAEEAFPLLTRVMEYARTDFPGVKLFLCNVRPTPFELELPEDTRREIRAYNGLVAEYSAAHDDVTLVDHYLCRGFFEAGRACELAAVRRDIFIEDKLHMNPAGYEIYARFFKEILKDLL